MPAKPRRRWWIALVLLGVAAVVLWASGGLTALLHHRMSRALAARNYESAEDVLAWVRHLGCANAETSFWEARLRRKQLRVADVPPLLTTAEQGGFNRERVRREAVLLQAQTGQIWAIVDQLNALMVDPRDDGAEICEAYVNGALIAGATDRALAILAAWKQEFPRDPQPHYAHARLLEYRERNQETENELRAAIAKNGNHWPARYALGRILFSGNRIDEALTQFDAAARMRDNAAPLYQRAKCLRALSRPDEARAILVEVVQRPDDAIRNSFARVGEPQRGLPIPLELGTLESALGNYDAAVKWLNVVLEHDPKNVDARYARAVVLRGLKRTEEANRDFAEVQRVRALLGEVDRLVDEIQRSPHEPHLAQRCRVGELFIKHENGRRGEFWLREALNRDPNYAPAHALLAEYYEQLSRQEPGYAALAEEHRRAAGADAHKPASDDATQESGAQP